MGLGVWNKTLRVAMALIVAVSVTLTACGAPNPPPPPPPPPGGGNGPQFAISSPQDGALVAGPTFFAVQALDPSQVASVSFTADGEALENDAPGEDAYRVFFIPADYPAGDLELIATVKGKNGKTSTRTVTVTNVPDPPGSATVSANGAVLGTTEDNGAMSTLSIPPGAAQGASVSFEARTKAEIKAETGIDYDALGVTFLGAQEIDTSEPLDRALMVSSGGFGPMVQPGQAVVNYMIAPDADGDGVGELVVVNTASVAPNGDVISDPVPPVQVGGVTVTNRSGTRSLTTLQAGLRGPPGTLLEIDVTGFNPYSLLGNTATFRSSVDGTELESPALVVADDEDASRQVLRTLIPVLPAGSATLTLHNKSTGFDSEPIALSVQSPAPLSQPASTIIDAFLDQSIGLLAEGIPADPDLERYAAKARAELARVKGLMGELYGESQPEVQRFLTDLAAYVENVELARTAAFGPAQDTCYDPIIIREQERAALWLLAVGGFALTVAGGFSLIPGLQPAAAAVGAVGTGLLLAGGAVYALQWTMKTVWEPCTGPKPPTPTPTPTPGGGGGSGNTGMGSAVPPGGPGGGPIPTPPPPQGQSASNLRAAQLFEQTPGRVHVKVLSSGSPLAFSGSTDAGGYFYIPMIPDGQPFTAIATDTLTGETRTFEGVGRPIGEFVFMYFDFLSEDEGEELPQLPFDTNTVGTLDGQALYTFDGEAGQVVNLTALVDRPSGANLSASLRIIAPSGDIIRSRYGGLGPDAYWTTTSPFELPESGPYIFELSTPTSGAFGYTLGFAEIEAPTPLSLTEPILTTSSRVSVVGDHQYFRVSGAEGEQHNLVLDVSDGDLTAYLWLRRDDGSTFFNGTIVRSAGTYGQPSGRVGETQRFALPETGDYILEIDPSYHVSYGKASFLGPYELSVFSPETEAIALDSNAQARLEPYGFNVFSFDADEGDLINAAFVSEDGFGGSGSVNMTIYDPSGGVVAGRGGRDYAETFITRLAFRGGGTFSIVVDGNGVSAGDYTLGLSSIEEPTALSLSPPSINVGDELAVVGQHRFYSFSGGAGDVHNFILNHASGSLNARLYLRLDSGTEFFNGGIRRQASTTNNTRTAQTGDFALPETDAYVLEILPVFDDFFGLDSVLGVYDITVETP